MIDSKVIAVVEPHADDAYLSLHQHMVDWIKAGKIVIILTVYSGTRKRAKDAEAYANAIGAQWAGFGLVESQDGNVPEIKLADVTFDPLPGMLGMLYDHRDVTVIGPAGIQHPEHQEVRRWIYWSYKGKMRNGVEFSYVEIPYYTKHKNQQEVNDKLEESCIASIKKPKHYKADEKYWKCFKDQSKFFHFNPAEGYKDIPELIVYEPIAT